MLKEVETHDRGHVRVHFFLNSLSCIVYDYEAQYILVIRETTEYLWIETIDNEVCKIYSESYNISSQNPFSCYVFFYHIVGHINISVTLKQNEKKKKNLSIEMK